MAYRRTALALLTLTLSLTVASPAPATPDKCTATKLSALSKAQKGALTCYTKKQLDPAYDEAACLAKNLAKLEKKVVKAGNSCAGIYADCAARIPSCPAAVAAAGPAGATACETSKQKASGKYAAALLKCLRVDDVPACAAKAAAKFTSAISKADAAGACAGTEVALTAAITTACVEMVAPDGDPIPLCTGCDTSADCTGGQFCNTGICTDDTCTPGAMSCNGDDLTECDADGGSTSVVVTCESCVDMGGGDAWCACEDDWNCPSGYDCVVDQCMEGATCTAEFVLENVLPLNEIQWGGTAIATPDAVGSPFPLSSQVSTTPLVINLDDDNEDGVINELDSPEIVFMSYCANDISVNGNVRAIHGGGPNKGGDYFATCGATVWHEGDSLATACACSNGTANSTAILAAGDIDNDGVPEIVVPNENAGLTILSNTGIPITSTLNNQWTGYPGPAPVIANLDNQGFAEIVVGRHVFTLGHDGGGNLVFVDRFSGALMSGVQGLGPAPCVADISGDTRPEVIAGTTVYAMPVPPMGVTKIADCPMGATDDFCLGSLTVVWDGQTVNGPASIPNTQRDGFCAIADVLGVDETIAPGPDNPLDGKAEVVLINEGYLVILNGETGVRRRFTNLAVGADGGPPAIGDFDGDGFPEIGSAFGLRYLMLDLQDPSSSCPAWPNAFNDAISGLQGNPPRTPGGTCADDEECADGAVCARGDCTCLHNGWSRITEDDSSRATSSAAFDFNGDGADEIVYNDECYLRIYQGIDGSITFKNNSPSRTRLESPTIADADNDGSAEIILSTNNENASCSSGINFPNGVAMWGADGDVWLPARRVWNQHAYQVTNVTEGGAIPVEEPKHWTPLNGRTYNVFRSNPRMCTLP